MIELRNVSIAIKGVALNDISLRVEAGQYAVLMGRTGVGKTSILESICGLRSLHSGSIVVNDQDVTNWMPGDRSVGYVPQDLALFPTFTVHEHLAFALKLRRVGAKEIAQRVAQLASELGISHLLTRHVQALSGGESQRVALGRSLSFRPSVLLLDEPLSALDADTRLEMQELLRKVQRSSRVTVLHVTHDQDEASALADVRFHLTRDEPSKRIGVSQLEPKSS